PGRLGGLCSIRAVDPAIRRFGHRRDPPEYRLKKKDLPPPVPLAQPQETQQPRRLLRPPQVLLAQDQEIQQLMSRFLTTDLGQLAIQGLDFEVLLRTAVFNSTNQLMGYLFQKLADRIDAAYQSKPGYVYKGRVDVTLDCIFGSFKLERDYYYHEGKQLGHYPADAALGLEGAKTPALARLVCLEG